MDNKKLHKDKKFRVKNVLYNIKLLLYLKLMIEHGIIVL